MGEKILVVGSSNTDMVTRTTRFPRPGETVLGDVFLMNAGGKGANQAVAAARLGGDVIFVCKTGCDVFGKQSRQIFAHERIDTSWVFEDTDHPSGVATITVNGQGENCIVVASGANAHLMPEDLDKAAEAIEKSLIVLVQLEIPIDTVERVVGLARAKGKTVILNPAPVPRMLSRELLRGVSVLTPNETEASLISGIEVVDATSAREAARAICAMGVETVIITLGAKGALVWSDIVGEEIPAEVVEAVDTTAAGDVFNGALAVALSEGCDMNEAALFACRAASISVTRIGAQTSAPYREELVQKK